MNAAPGRRGYSPSRCGTTEAAARLFRADTVSDVTFAIVLAADDSIPFWGALLIGGALIAGSILVAVVNNRAVQGRLGPNHVAGMRTKATMSSPEAWQAAHKAAKPWVQFGTMAGFVSGVAVIALSSSATALLAVLAVGVVLSFGAVVAGAVVADREAKRVLASG